MKTVLLFVICILVGGMALFGWQFYQKQQSVAAISSFEECAAMFPVMESYPARCVTSDGRSFTQDIGNESEYSDEVLLEHPRPNQGVTSPLRVAGQARGSWFFEADFPIELIDAKGNSITVSYVQAQEEWMTEAFVPFEGKLIFEKPDTSTGKLILRNANPSGLSENQKELEIPVKFSE